jgi:hypothetical protein
MKTPCILIIFLLCACSSVTTYLKDRALDLTDVIDVKIGGGYTIVGAKVEVTDYVGMGIGAGVTFKAYEVYGRRYYSKADGMFIHLILIGFDDTPIDNHDTSGASLCILGYNDRWNRPPMIGRYRVGGEVLLLGGQLGLYANLGEVLDFLSGLAGFDPADDDGVPKFDEFDLHIRRVIARDKKEDIGKLILDLRFESEYKKGRAADILGHLKAVESIEYLIEALETDPHIRFKIARAMQKITGLSYGLDIEKWESWWIDAKNLPDHELNDLLKSKRKETQKFIWNSIYNLSHEKDADRKIAVQELGQLRATDAIEDLIWLLEEDPSEVVKSEAAKALEMITEEKFGKDVNKWKKWWEDNEEQYDIPVWPYYFR